MSLQVVIGLCKRKETAALISQKIFSRRACPRKTAKNAQQVATDLLDAEMFYKEDYLHGIVHIQSRTVPMEEQCFF